MDQTGTPQDGLALSRRTLLRSTAVAAALPALSPFEAFADARHHRLDGADYGPLQDVLDDTTGLPLLRLPRGFRYVSMGWRGDVMEDGVVTPGAHDGAACFVGQFGRVYYVRNHELGSGPSFAAAERTFDRGSAAGGTTTLVFDPYVGRYVKSYASLSGTVRNCAGGATPWDSWLTCEESLDNANGSTRMQDHGWVFEVPAMGLGTPVPITGLGRFTHEAVAVDPRTGYVYATEDMASSGLYRFRPRKYGALHDGGELEMLVVKGHPQFATRDELRQGDVVEVEWAPITEPTRRDHTPGDRAGVFIQGWAQGGAAFSRGEGAWYGNDRIYFISTDGGRVRKGQVFELDPATDTLRVIYESPGASVLDNPDNVCVGPRGGLVLCEDGGSFEGQWLRGLTTDGHIFPLAQNNVVLDGERNRLSGNFRGGEFAGAAFTPCGKWLLVSIQTPGITFAITGPWGRGQL